MTHYSSNPSLHNLEFLTLDEMANVEVIKGDIEDPYFVRRAVENCDVVFHIAALIAIPYSYIAPASYVATNIYGTLNVLEACKSEGTTRLVHTSTSECYGTAQYTPIDEKHPLQGQSPYSASKIAADVIGDEVVVSNFVALLGVVPERTNVFYQFAEMVNENIIEGYNAVLTVTCGWVFLKPIEPPFVELMNIPVGCCKPSIETGLVCGYGELRVNRRDVFTVSHEQTREIFGEIDTFRIVCEHKAKLSEGFLDNGWEFDDSRHSNILLDFSDVTGTGIYRQNAHLNPTFSTLQKSSYKKDDKNVC